MDPFGDLLNTARGGKFTAIVASLTGALGPSDDWPTMPPSLWTDAFLDEMRTQGDALADEAMATLYATGEVGAVDALFKTLVLNDGIPPEGLPPVIADYLARTSTLAPLDQVEVRRGEALFGTLGPEMLLVLGFYSLPASYSARKGVQVLYRTGYLLNRPVRRVFETTQMVVDVMARDGLAPDGRGVRTAQKVRLLHAAIRHLLTHDTTSPWDPSLGAPLNQEDLAGTLTVFGYVVLDGLDRLGIAVADADREAYVHAWAAVGRIMGVREELIPESFAEAKQLAGIIYGRQIAESPEGVAMAKALVDGLQTILPGVLHGLPASLVHYFLDDDPFTHQNIAAMLQVPPANWTESVARIVGDLGELLERISGDLDPAAAIIRHASRELVKGMLRAQRGGRRAPFAIPPDLADEWKVV
jgi:ER-bound oxygenase mpaB/B'/Rubber oxygenase, catalytic domain